MQTKHRLLSISRWLASVPSLGYALVYLLLIPVFALVYYELPGHFYHSTLQQESSLTAQFEEIKQKLSSLIVTQYREVPATSENHLIPRGSERPKYWTAAPEGISHLSINENEISFQLHAKYYVGIGMGNGDNYTRSDLLDLIIPAKLHLWQRRIHNDEGYDYESQPIMLDLSPDVVHIFPDRESQLEFTHVLFPKNVFREPDIGLNVPEADLEKIRAYAIATKGDSSGASGNFVRMLYLSAVTITTLGFGDVVPMTTASRVLVSIEAIMGIVLIGLFLNALSFERATMEEEERKFETQKRKLKDMQNKSQAAKEFIKEYLPQNDSLSDKK